MKKILALFAAVLLFPVIVPPVFGFAGGGAATAPAAPVITEPMKELTIPLRQEGSKEILQVPLFSAEHANLPVATVDGEAISLQEFALELAAMHTDMGGGEKPGKQSFTTLLDRLISIKLAGKEAMNIGFDRTPEVQNQLENFALKAMIQQLLAAQIKDLEVSPEEVEEMYRQMALEAKLLTYRFFDEEEAAALLTTYRAGGDFKKLADKAVAGGKAEGGEKPEYTRLNDLFPAVAKAVFAMKKGDVSEVFKAEKGFLVFRLEDQRVFEDAEIRTLATERVYQRLSQKTQMDYLKSLEEKYVVFYPQGQDALNFAHIAEEKPNAKGTEIFAVLTKDQSPVATLNDGKETVTITVAEIAKKLEATMYHGTDRAIDAASLDKQKETILWNRLVAVSGRMEARAQGIDKSPELQAQLEKFKERVLFDAFMAKAVVPGIKVPEDEVKKYYYNHLEDYSSPLMVKLQSLVFTSEKGAREAIRKLQAGSDFKWVSANTSGQADADDKELLKFDGNLLTVTALPESLHHDVEVAKPGDSYYYAGPGDLHYAVMVESIFPPKAQTYEEVRQEVGKIVYAQMINDALAEWVEKLKDAYKTKIYLVQENL